jgi:hypothetical protein
MKHHSTLTKHAMSLILDRMMQFLVAQEVIALLTVSCQKGQRTGLPFHFVFFRKRLRHPA